MQKLNFKKEGQGDTALVLLHGWPGNLARWDALTELLKDRYTIYRIDFPGWGETPLTHTYTLQNYAEDLEAFLAAERLTRPVIVGHSFGGRVAIKLLSQKPGSAEKLVLIASAGIERKGTVVRMIAYLKPFIPKFLRRIFRPLVASPDYLELSGSKRETFNNIISENLEPLLSRISIPTLLIWGAHDHLTPLWQGRLMEKLIPHNQFVLIHDGDHGLPYRKAELVAGSIKAFI